MSSNGSSNSSKSSNSNISNSNMSTQTNKITPQTMVGSTSLLGLMRNNAPKENGIRKTGINGKEVCSYLRMLVINPESQFHGLEITNILFPALVSEVGDEDVWSETKFYRLNNAANSSRWTWTLATRNNRRKSSSNGGKRRGKKQVEFKPMTFRSNDGETKDAGRTYGYGYGEQYILRQMIEACHMDKFNGQPNLECGAKSKNIPEGLVACLNDDEVAPTSQELVDAEIGFWEKCIHGSANNEGSSSTTTTTTTTTTSSVWSRFDVTDVLRDYPFNVQRMLLKLFVKHIEDMDESTGKMLLDAYRKMILEDSKRIEEFERQACYQINKVTDGIFKGQRRALDALGIESVEHPDKPKGQPYGKPVNGKRKLGYKTAGDNWKPISNHRLAWVCDPNGPKNLFMTEVTSTGAEALGIEEESSSSESSSSSSSSEDESSSDDDDDESEDESKKKKKKKQVESSEEDSNEESSEEESSEDESSEDEQAKSKKKKKKKQEEVVVDEEDDDEDDEDDDEEEEEDNEDEEEDNEDDEDNEDEEEEEEEEDDEEEEHEVDKERAKRTKDYEKHPVATLKKIYKTKYLSKHGQTPSEENWPNKAALVQAIMELVQVNEEEESTDGSSSKKRKRDEEVDFDNMKISEVKKRYREYCPLGRTPNKLRMMEIIQKHLSQSQQ